MFVLSTKIFLIFRTGNKYDKNVYMINILKISIECQFHSVTKKKVHTRGWAKLTSLTVVAEHEESGSREIRVELDEDDVGGGVDRLQSRVAAELADLRGRLVRAVPGWWAGSRSKKLISE